MSTTTFEEILSRDGVLVYRTRGVSMEPMLRQNRDLVVIKVPSSRLERFDVAFYKRGGSYVLHRVISAADDHYLIRGDNTFSMETVPDEAVLGVLTEFRRKGRQISADAFGYRLYVRVWNALYPLRYVWFRFCRFAVRLARKLGILPFLKALLKKDS